MIDPKPFWREEALTSADVQTIDLLQNAHARCIDRQNPSSTIIRLVAHSSCIYLNSVIAGMASLGDMHGPVHATCAFLKRAVFDPEVTTDTWLKLGPIPGWGNSFVKDGPDPAFSELHSHLEKVAPLLTNTANRVTAYLHGRGKVIYVNPSFYTAASSFFLRLPDEMALWLFLRSRLDGWARLFFENYR